MNFQKLKQIGLLLFLVPATVKGSPCSAVFPDALQSNGSGNTITFFCGTRVINNPNTTIGASTVVHNSPFCPVKTCSTTNNCVSGSPANQLNSGEFQMSSSTVNLTVNSGLTATIGNNGNLDIERNNVTLNQGTVAKPTTLNFVDNNANGTNFYRINTLSLAQNSVVNFKPGDYWINTLNIVGEGDHIFNVVGTSGTVRLFINNSVNINKQISWNKGSSATNPAKQLFVYFFEDFTLSDINSQIKGILYAVGDVTLIMGGDSNGDIQGAVTGHNITLRFGTVKYDGEAVNALDFGGLCPPAGSVDHLLVEGPLVGVKCLPVDIKVTAKIGNTTATAYNRTITLNTQSGAGIWSLSRGAGTFVQSRANSGIATYTFNSADKGSAVFRLNHAYSSNETANIQAYETFNSLIRGSFYIGLFSDGFLMTSSTSPTIPFNLTQIAGNNPGFNIRVSFYEGDNCTVNTQYTGTKRLYFWFNRFDPNNGTVPLNINGINISNNPLIATGINVNFVNGVTNLNVFYRDVGKIRLNVFDLGSLHLGSTDVFVVKPHHFAISGPGIPGTTSPIGSVFKKAGELFTVVVDAQGNDNINTPNYGKESDPQGILLQSQAPMPLPVGGRNGSANNGLIGNGSSFAPTTIPGRFQGDHFYFDEVGSINLIASVEGGSYLEAGDVPVRAATVVGRFIPDHFDVSGNVPQFNTACELGQFTYLDQPFFYKTRPIMTITAKAATGSPKTVTQNYTGALWRLSGSGLGALYNKGYYPVNVGDTIPTSLILGANIPIPTFTDLGNGTGTFTFSDGGGLKLQRLANTLTPALRAEIQLKIANIQDSDGVRCTGNGCVEGGFTFGNTQTGTGIDFTNGKIFYHGRIVLLDSLGTELSPLLMPMQTQFYSSTDGYVLNKFDSCTLYSGMPQSLLLSPSAGLSTTASLIAPAQFTQGTLNITLSAPNTPGYVDIEADLSANAANLPWLQYNWPYQGTPGTTFNNNPRGRASFGLFKGNDRIIYEKEIYP